ncbi:MAG: regulatory protein [Clostridiales bacterium]|jgi:regulatory protein|nr:regulatory protein [Clostridiales bacterium]MDK2934267.1 regulatory protein [Clostridiales bacterium]
MTITSIENKKKNSSKKSIFVDGKYVFSIDEEDLFRLNLYVGKEITKQEIENIRQICNYSKAKILAIKFIVFKKRTEYEVKTKLEKLGFDHSVIEKVLDYLKQSGYVNDAVYTKKYIKDALTLKKWGIYRIRYELQMKGIDEGTIQHELTKIEFDEKQNQILKALVEKKLSSVRNLDERSLNKIKNYCIRKGYDLNAVNKVINELLDGDI